MIRSLFGFTTVVGMLRGGLEETSATQRGISSRVARATQASATTDFAGALQRATDGAADGVTDGATTGAGNGAPSEIDLQTEMVALADTQLRFEAQAKLLHEAYGQIRTAMRNG